MVIWLWTIYIYFAAEIGAFLIFISTDYVFDGTKPPYKPGDATNPLNKYGVSKLDGEKVVQAIQSSKSAWLWKLWIINLDSYS